MNPPRRGALLALMLVTLLALGAGGAARAEIGASASLESDYRFRGPSLSDRRPALTLSLSYDHPSGAYLGGAAIVTDSRHDGVEALGFMENAGFVKRLNDRVSLDVGVSNANLKRYTADRTSELNYTEVYAGLIGANLNFHAYYSPNYVRAGIDTIYLDLGGVMHPWDKWRVSAHLGYLGAANSAARAFGIRHRYDARIGLAREFKHWDAHVVWTGYGPQTVRPGAAPPSRSAVVFGATYFF